MKLHQLRNGCPCNCVNHDSRRNLKNSIIGNRPINWCNNRPADNRPMDIDAPLVTWAIYGSTTGHKWRMWVRYWLYVGHTSHYMDLIASYGSYMGHSSVIYGSYAWSTTGHIWAWVIILVMCGSHGSTMGHIYCHNWVKNWSCMGQTWAIYMVIHGKYGSTMGHIWSLCHMRVNHDVGHRVMYESTMSHIWVTYGQQWLTYRLCGSHMGAV